jgi:hypothetical protein
MKIMIEFDDSEKTIKGLVKLIIQEPRIFAELKIWRNHFEKNDALSNRVKEKKYLNKQLKIIEKAENIANQNLWYCFQLEDTSLHGGEQTNQGYMLYQRIDDEMIPIQEDFESGHNSKIKEIEYLIKIIKDKKIEKIITYSPFYQETLFCQKYEVSDSQKDEPIQFNHFHETLEEEKLNLLKTNNIEIVEYNEKQTSEFEKDLKWIRN